MAKPESPTRRKPRFRERHAVKQTPPAVRRSLPPPPPPLQPRTVGERRPLHLAVPQVTREQALYLVLIFGGFALRIWDVGSRAMHGDEAEHAWFAWHLYNGTGYQYDPVYHGPLQFILTAALFFLFGVSNTVARLLAVLFGTGIIAVPYFLRQYMGRPSALLGSALLAISPAFVYVSRLERDDILASFFAFALAAAIFSYLRTGRIRYVYVGAAAVALSLSAMENTYITLFVFGTFVLLVLLAETMARAKIAGRLRGAMVWTGPPEVVRGEPLLLLGGLLLVTFVLMTVTGVFLPLLVVLCAGLVLLVVRQAMLQTVQSGEPVFTQRLLQISWQQWLNALTIMVAILFLTYSTFGTNLRGIWDASQPFLNTSGHACPGNSYVLNPCRKDIIGGLFYWLSQHQQHRGDQPWFYYSLLFGLYEQIAVFLGVGGILWFLRRPTVFTTFLTYWAVLMFGIYSWAGEKFPWLMIHPLLPFTLLAAMFVADVARRPWPLKWIVLAALAFLALLEAHSTWEVNFVNGADPVEMMVYVQSAPDTPKVAADIISLSNKVTNGNDLNVSIDAEDTWPFAWYLRDLTHVGYPAYPALLQKPFSTDPVIIVDQTHQPALYPRIRKNYSGQLYRLRWWFPEDYKLLTWQSFSDDLVNPSYWKLVTQWLKDRRPFGPKDGLWFYYYVKHGLASPY